MIAERLTAAAATGSVSSLSDLYRTDALLEAHLPGRSIHARGSTAILDELGTWFDGPGDVTFRSLTPASDGLTLRLERRDRATGAVARWRHLVHVDAGRIRRHIVYAERPVRDAPSAPLPDPDDPGLAALLARVVHRTALQPTISGTVVERLDLDDGTAVFAKHLVPRDSWIMRATMDRGREASLWSWGIFSRIGEIVEHGVVGAVPEEREGWLLIARDLSAALSVGARSSGSLVRRVLSAIDELHARLAGQANEGLCGLADRLLLFSPATAERERDGEDLAPKVIGRGWELFSSVAPRDVVEAVAAIHERPQGLAGALVDATTTLVHGDLRPANVGSLDGRVVLLDWGLAAEAPTELDLAWYLFNLAGPGGEPGRREVSRRLFDGSGAPASPMVELALLSTLAQTGCYFAHRAVQDPDEGVRRAAVRDLQWWIDGARRSLARPPAGL